MRGTLQALPLWIGLVISADRAVMAQDGISRIDGQNQDRGLVERLNVPQEFGTQEEIIYNVNPADFQNGTNWGGPVALVGDSFVEPEAATDLAIVVAPVHLPSGVLITRITFYYFDDHPTLDPNWLGFQRCRADGSGCQGVAPLFVPQGTPGWTSVSIEEPNERIDNAQWHYSVDFRLHRDLNTGERHRISCVAIRYRRDVSPAPASARFGDVPLTHPFFRYVEALAAAGITSGCSISPPQFCPNAQLTRGQAAVFLAAALGLHWAP